MSRTLTIIFLLANFFLGCSDNKTEHKGFTSEQEFKVMQHDVDVFLKNLDKSLHVKNIGLLENALDKNVSIEILQIVNGKTTKQILNKEQYLEETIVAWKTSTEISEKRLIKEINKVDSNKVRVLSKVYNSFEMNNGETLHLSSIENLIISIKEKNDFKILSIDIKVKPL